LVQNQITDSDKPPGQQLENLAAIKTPVSFETYLKKEAFLLRKSLFPQEEKNIQVQVITNINTCKNLFNEFSPQDSIFSTWDFRYAWYLGYKYHPCFFVIYLEKKPIGLLPLWYEHDKNQFRWFGSWWMEDNSFWVFNKKYIPLLLSACPPRTYLNAISLETPGLAPLLNLKKEQIREIFNRKKLHRFNEEMAENFYSAIQKIHDNYNNDASNIWKGNPKSAAIVRRFLEFRGMGVKIATMTANILARNFKIPMEDHICIDISPDVHIKRVFKRIGYVGENASNEELLYKARELNPTYPGIFDLSCWEIGRKWCRPTNPDCENCYLNELCEKNYGERSKKAY